MTILNKVAFAYLKKNKTRTLVTIIGVILSVALITLVTTLAASFHHLLLNDAIETNGDYTLVYEFKTGVEQKGEQKLRQNEQIAESYRTELLALTTLPSTVMASADVPSFAKIIGAEPLGFEKLPFGKVIGNLPQNNHELLVSSFFINQTGNTLQVGSQLDLSLVTALEDYHPDTPTEKYLADLKPDQKTDYRISGIYQPQQDSETWSSVYKFYTTIASQPAAGHPSALYLRLKDPGQWRSFKKQYSGKNLTDPSIQLNSPVSELQGYGSDDQSDNLNLMLTGAAAIFILLIASGSILLIHNAFSMSVNERLQQFGLLSSVGATKKQLRHSVLFEGIVIGAVAIPLGLISGLLLVYLGHSGFLLLMEHMQEKDFAEFLAKLEVVTNWQVLAVAAAAGWVTILISAWLPARKALKSSAITVIRQNEQIRITAKKVKTSSLTTKVFGFPGLLALKNFKRNRKVYHSTILSLVVSIVLFISTSSLVMYGESSIQRAGLAEPSDVTFTAFHETDEQVLEIFKKFDRLSQIKERSWQTNNYLMTEFPADSLSDTAVNELADSVERTTGERSTHMVSFLGLDDETFTSWAQQLGLIPADFYQNSETFTAIADQHNSYYDEGQKKFIEYDMLRQAPPLTLTLTKVSDAVRVPINTQIHVSHYTESAPELFRTATKTDLAVYLPFTQWERLKQTVPEVFQTGDKKTVFSYAAVTDEPDKTAEAMRSILQSYPNVEGHIANNAANQRSTRNMLTAVKILAYSFIGIISLIAAANVFNTISTNISLRRRELAMLSSVGMGPGAVKKMMRFECLLYGTKALLWGLPVSLLIDFAVYKFMIAGVEQPFLIPWQAIGISSVCVFAIVFATMIYAVRKLQKENIIAGLRGQ